MDPATAMLRSPGPRIAIRGLFFASIVTLPFGCSHPNGANIAVRKENQQLRDRVAELERANAGFVAPTTRESAPSLDLSRQQFGSLFVANSLKLGKLTGEDDGMLKVYAVPVDQDGDEIKSAGTFTVDAFDLTDSGKSLGHWVFPATDSHKIWYGSGLLHTFVLKCPWQSLPAHEQVTVKVQFTDELTGRIFTQQKVITVRVSGTHAAGK